MKNPIACLLLASLSLVLVAPAALATPAVTVDADANNTIGCRTAPRTIGGPDLYLTIHEDCSVTVHADTNNVTAQCAPHSTGDVLPGLRSLSVSNDHKCDLFVAVSL